MVNLYQNTTQIFVYTIILITLLTCLLILLNIFLYKIFKKKSTLVIKKYNKRRETYELRVNSIGNINIVNTSQTIILALLFLLFNIKMTFLIPMIYSLQSCTYNKQIISCLYIIFIMISIYIKITSNIISFYKSKQIKYIL